MARFQTRKDGGYYTVVKRYDQVFTLQIHPEGGNYLLEHEVWPGEEIPDTHRRHLEEQGWFYTRGELEPGQLVDGDLPNRDVKDLQDAEDVFESPLGKLPIYAGSDEVSETKTIEVESNDPVQAHASGPVFLFDASANIHYTVLHLKGGDGYTEPLVMCIKWRAADLLKAHGVRIGSVLPAGTFHRSVSLPELLPESRLATSRI